MVAVSFILSACDTTLRRGEELPISTDRFNTKGLSVLPPQEKGWIFAGAGKTGLNLVKRGTNTDETYAATVSIFNLPHIPNKSKFLQFVKMGHKKDTDQNRFNLLSYNAKLYKGESEYCVKFNSKAEDKEAIKRSSKQESMILEIIGFNCRHPYNNSIAIQATYSHRYYSGNKDKNLNKKAAEFLNNVLLTPM